jgi:predicted pore-forming effector associated with SMODS systems
MANNIAQRQNEDQSLQLLSAQRRLYSWAKIALAIQVIVVVVIPGVLVVVEHFEESLKLWAALAGLVISILDVLLLDPVKAALRHKAAATQELFDCHVLELDWPSLKAEKPDREDVHGVSAGYDEADGLRDWYPTEVGTLPLYVARIICQRSNCWWDSKLRRFYRNVLYVLAGIGLVTAFVAASAWNLTLGDFVLSVMAPILPLVLWAIREAKQQSEAAERAARLKSFGDNLWGGVLQGNLAADKADAQSRAFQDEIYEHRRDSPMIFDWFYALFKDRFESQMTQGAADMIREAHEKGL